MPKLSPEQAREVGEALLDAADMADQHPNPPSRIGIEWIDGMEVAVAAPIQKGDDAKDKIATVEAPK